MGVIIDSINELPSSLTDKVSEATDIVVYVQYGDELQCSLDTLRGCSALRIGLINRGCLVTLPHLEENAEAFDFYIYYDGPDLDHQDFGSIRWLNLQKEKQENPTAGCKDDRSSGMQNGSINGVDALPDGPKDTTKIDIIVPEAYAAIKALLEFIMPFVKRKDRFFLVAQNEEVLIQTALFRELYDLPIGLSSKQTAFFVDKAAQKQFFENKNVPRSKGTIVTTEYLRSLSNKELSKFLSRPDVPQFPIFAKPVAGAGAFETFSMEDTEQLKTWLAKSVDFIYSDFILQEKLVPPQYMTMVVYHEGGIKTPHISKSMTAFGDFVQKGQPIVETHLRRDDPEFQEVAKVSRDAIAKLNLGPSGYGCYFVDCMRKVDGSLAVMEVQCRYPCGLFVTGIAEDMHGLDVESFSLLWPFVPYSEDSSKIRYKHACVIVYPTMGGTLVDNHQPDPKLFLPGTELRYISHMFHPGDQIPPQPLSIVHILAELAITGNNYDDVIATARNVIDGFNPVTTK